MYNPSVAEDGLSNVYGQIMEEFHIIAYALQIAVPMSRKFPIPSMSHPLSGSSPLTLSGRRFYTVWQIAVQYDTNSFSAGHDFVSRYMVSSPYRYSHGMI